MELIIGLGILVLVAILAMLGFTMLYYIVRMLLPIFLVILVAVGLIYGLVETMKNMIRAIKTVYGKAR